MHTGETESEPILCIFLNCKSLLTENQKIRYISQNKVRAQMTTQREDNASNKLVVSAGSVPILTTRATIENVASIKNLNFIYIY